MSAALCDIIVSASQQAMQHGLLGLLAHAKLQRGQALPAVQLLLVH